jgi:hypothetical protein
MSEKKSVRDEHGVHDLLQKVSMRNLKLSKLANRGRKKEVSETVDPVEEDSAEIEVNSNSDVGTNAENSSDAGPPETKWGKGLFQKLSKLQNPLAVNVNNSTDRPQQQQNDQKTTPRPDPKEFFRNFSIKNPLRPPQQQTAPNNNDDGENKNERTEIKKVFERSTEQGKEIFLKSKESGKEMFQNISTNFQGFRKNFQNSLSPLKQNRRATASAVSDSLCSPPVKTPTAVPEEN